MVRGSATVSPELGRSGELRIPRELRTKLVKNRPAESAVAVDRSLNILGAMMMRTGWVKRGAVLSESCLVIKPELSRRCLILEADQFSGGGSSRAVTAAIRSHQTSLI